MFCSPKPRLVTAIKNNQLTTWSDLIARAVKKYPPNHAPATDKGHTKRHKKGIQSTKQKTKDDLESIEVNRCINPPLEQEKTNQLFVSLAYEDTQDDIIYTDLTGNFPVRSIDGYTTFFLLYDWTTNAVLETPIEDTTDESTVAEFKENIEYLAEKGFSSQYST